MVYKYIFVPRVKSNRFIVITYNHFMFFITWGFGTALHNQSIPCLNIVIISKTLYLSKFKECQDPEVLLSDLCVTPYPYSQGGGLFFWKYIYHTLSSRYSVNDTLPTMKPLVVRGSHHIYFHANTRLTRLTLHTNRDNTQHIGRGMMTLTNKFWVGRS